MKKIFHVTPNYSDFNMSHVLVQQCQRGELLKPFSCTKCFRVQDIHAGIEEEKVTSYAE